MAEAAPRNLGTAVLCGVACGGLMLLAASRPWSAVTVSPAGAPSAAVEVSGTQAVPLLGALALVVLAGSAAILPTAAGIRRGVGVVLAVAGLAAAVVAVTADGAVRDALADAVAASPASLAAPAATAADAGVAWWRWVVALAGLAASFVGAATAWRGHTWAVMGARYDAPAGGGHEEDDPWRALDAGRDPTT